MQGLLRAYNLTHDQALSQLVKILEENKETYGAARIRCVSVEGSGLWQNALCIVNIYSLHDQSAVRPSRKYEGVHLLEEWIKPSELRALLDFQEKHCLRIGGEEIALAPHVLFNEWEYLPSNNEYSSYPGCIFRTSTGQSSPIANHDPLLSWDSTLPFYPNPYFAIQEWSELKHFHRERDARIGAVHVFLPQFRSFFSSLTCRDNKVIISIAGYQTSNLRIKGSWEHGYGCKPFDVSVNEPEIVVDMDNQPEGFEVYLLGPDRTVYDFHRETRYWVLGQERVLQSIPSEGTDESTILDAIQRGEGPGIEFKPFVRKGDTKQEELVRTVIAFANTSGGVLFIGVSNQCVIDGIEKEIVKEASKNSCTVEEELHRYIGWLRQCFAGELNKELSLNIISAVVSGHTVVIVRVPEGEKKPYASIRSNAIYVRRGANNAFPHPDHELPQLLKSDSEHQSWP